MSDVHSAAPSERWEREDTWQSLAIAAAVILLIGFVAASVWVIIAPDDRARLLRVQISAPFGVLGGAVVTFCTIVWRGLISKRQADAQIKATNLQREQIDKLALQIAATDENNLAELLQKGAQLISAGTKKAHVAAGIAVLQSVVEAQNPKFASQAMNLLADFVQENYRYGEPGNSEGAAMAALARGAELDRTSTRRLVFDARERPRSQIETEEWILITGVLRVRYLGGRCEGLQDRDMESKTKYSFSEVEFDHGDIDLRIAQFRNCSFNRCGILGGTSASIKRNQFDSCDFSGAKIRPANGFPDLSSGGNYYEFDTPPQGNIRGDWASFFNVIMPMPDDTEDENEGGP
jgi:hypothetical protein